MPAISAIGPVIRQPAMVKWQISRLFWIFEAPSAVIYVIRYAKRAIHIQIVRPELWYFARLWTLTLVIWQQRIDGHNIQQENRILPALHWISQIQNTKNSNHDGLTFGRYCCPLRRSICTNVLPAVDGQQKLIECKIEFNCVVCECRYLSPRFHHCTLFVWPSIVSFQIAMEWIYRSKWKHKVKFAIRNLIWWRGRKQQSFTHNPLPLR